MARSKAEAIKDKIELGRIGAAGGSLAGTLVGGPAGTAIGGLIGAGAGLYLGDQETVFPLDMIAIPAYQAFMIQGPPSMQIYIRAGETLMPTGGNVEDVQQVVGTMALEDTPKPKKKTTAYQRKYRKAFATVKPNHMKANGTWKKDGFKRAVKEAHKIAGGKK